MKYDFDQVVERRNTDSFKWRKYGENVVPLWVADMDFVSPEPVVQALKERVDHRMFGYGKADDKLAAVICERMKERYGWEVAEEHIVFIPGVVAGLNLAFLLFAGAGDVVLVQPPVYSHFITDPVNRGRAISDPPLMRVGDSYEIDFDAFERAITPRTKLFVLCNPHNPVGRVFRRDELERLAEICLRRGLLICSDEIHCDLLYPGYRHIPIATLGRETADRTITLMSPSKTFNLAGLACAFAVIPNPAVRETWLRGSRGLMPFVNVMGFTAALAAFRDGQEWLDQALSYLDGNRDLLAAYLKEKLTSIKMTRPEATYLAWLDCSQSGIKGDPFRFFLEKAGVALNDGNEYGKGGNGFVRLNFGCPRTTLLKGLDRMAEALRKQAPSLF